MATDTTDAVPEIVPSFAAEADTDRKLAIICSRARSTWRTRASSWPMPPSVREWRTILFFTFWGFDLITKSRMHDLQVSPAGNTAMHPIGDLHFPQALAPVPGMTALATRSMRKSIDVLGIPDVPAFLDQIVAAGGHLWACRMSADMNHLTETELRDDVEAVISASDFI